MKKRFFGLIMSIALIISSINVFAGSNYAEFGSGRGRGEAYLSANGGQTFAQTVPVYSDAIVDTNIRALGKYNNGPWVGTGTYASTASSSADVCTGAESFHSIDGMYTYLTCSYN